MSSADNEVVDVREKIKSLEKEIKGSAKGMHDLREKKEGIEKKRTEALKVHAQVELDLRDVEERISGEVRAKVCLIGFNLFDVNLLFSFIHGTG